MKEKVNGGVAVAERMFTTIGADHPQGPSTQNRRQTAQRKTWADRAPCLPVPPKVATFSCATVLCYQPVIQNINMLCEPM